MNIPEYGDYIIFIDESGDHGLQFIDQEYPIFALVLVVIKKSDYYEKIVPDFLQLKFKYWGHDQVILHEHDIRKEKGLFGLLRTNPQLRSKFLDDLSLLIQQSPFEFIGAVIRKEQLLKKYSTPYNPYEIALKFCLEDTLSLLKRKGQRGKKTTLIVEGRGPKENKDLELEFRRICDNQRSWGYKTIDYTQIPFDLICVDKKCNSTGLQLAYLIARPIGLRTLRPEQDNRAMDAIKEKWRSVKCFP
jgi:Protein of unknown function (DUF3800)